MKKITTYMLMAGLSVTCHAEGNTIPTHYQRELDIPDNFLDRGAGTAGYRSIDDGRIIGNFFKDWAIALECGEDSITSEPKFIADGRQAKLGCVTAQGLEYYSGNYECGPTAHVIVIECATSTNELCDEAMLMGSEDKVTEVGFKPGRPGFTDRKNVFVFACQAGIN